MPDPPSPGSLPESSSLPQSEAEEPRRRDYSLFAVLLIFLVPALGGCLFGYDIGATSFTIAQMQSSSSTGWAALVGKSPAWQGILVSAASLGAFLGSGWVQQAADRIGRRQELRLGAFLYANGAILQVVGGVISSSWLGLLAFATGRVVYGLGIGIVMHAAPTYLSEQCPSQVRGIVVCCKEAAIVFGILLGYFVGEYWTRDTNGNTWIYSYASSLILIVNMIGLSYTIPRSCRWLILKQKSDEALQSLRFVWPEPGAAERELHTMQQAQVDEQIVGIQNEGSNRSSEELSQGFTLGQTDESSTPLLQSQVISTWPFLKSYEFLLDPHYRTPLLAGVGLVVLQQITGQPSVLSYATPIFEQAGLARDSSILVAAFKLAATFVAAVTVERGGRKKLLYFGCSLMLLALIILTCSIENPKSSLNTTLVLGAMFGYIGGYQFSFGPIAWLMISEVFPLRVRGQAVAFAVQMNFFWNAVVQFGVPVLSDTIGLKETFGLFAVLTMYSLYFIRRYVPETKGLTLEEIEIQFRSMQREEADEVVPLLEQSVREQIDGREG